MMRSRLRRLPLRVRLIAGFAVSMLIVLAGAGAFVYLRVRYALDLQLNEDLEAQSSLIAEEVGAGGAPTVAPGIEYQILDSSGRVLEASTGSTGLPLLTAHQLAAARSGPVRADLGDLFPIRPGTLRLYAVPLTPSTGAVPLTPSTGAVPLTPSTGAGGTELAGGRAAVAVVAGRRDQRDEALRELIGQLVLANLAALAVASVVGYRLTRAALAPVERYRAEATRIAADATGLRLDVPAGRDDELTRLGHTLNDMLAALDAALDRERRFVHDASHELRTPLTLISTEIELALRRSRSTAELEETLRNVAADTDRLRQLADTLLTVGVQAPPAEGATADLAALAEEVAASYPGVWVGHDATVNAQADPGTEHDTTAVAHADPDRMRQVLTNLLDNASRHGAPPITVTTGRDGPFVQVRVQDAGPGMEPEFLARATGRFTRADTARSTPGTGLGLSVVDAIVAAHGGELRLRSDGAGTVVTVLLPAAVRQAGPVG
ncbi:HAMP domain-containing histidine kinase [Actinoplanes sp. KI2]|uniref:sensor histidine kinase n=1 Tax=Actinoplanes sp. KI2 TaxID=2983315 RepID=UPI0021D5D6E3|nr:HAMP domain-containing sensor histidine kinase [Actinoplanes sp. KI2]MCU7726964.1 HAMP domain-containing histidine kinase [Actinoplanes sp. KI2]